MAEQTTARRWALDGVRVIDLTWLLVGPQATRILASFGAEVIRVEWRDPRAIDFLRYTPPFAPGGSGAAVEDRGLLSGSPKYGFNRSGNFNNINPGKLGITLNLNHPKGREILKRLVATADILCENFSPARMAQWGIAYDELSKLNPRLIYLQTTGVGKAGVYDDYVSYGPTAQALSGLTHLSGLPEPHPPAGWGYSYLDHSPGYYGAMLVMAALLRRRKTGAGCYIDLSQSETGMFLSGTSTLEHQLDGQPTRRHGNRMPFAPHAPHGIYQCAGDDEWIAIAVESDQQWRALADELGAHALANDQRLRAAAGRKANEDELDGALKQYTSRHERYELARRLQARGIAAGPVQRSDDRFERDPQLRARGYFVTLPHGEIGDWPIENFPAKLEKSPAFVGGRHGRASPMLGEDNDRVYRELLAMTPEEISALTEEGVI